jgi:aldehyde dehydrogenase (NAD+)
MNLKNRTMELLEELGIYEVGVEVGLEVRSPIDGSLLAVLPVTTDEEVTAALDRVHQRSLGWRQVPAPIRGALVRALGEVTRQHKEVLAEIITLETGKILTEARGEVQEVIDICEFAVGLSRQLYGLTIASERPSHKLLETWHPMGVCAVISAFNFPAAVWAWNAALAWVCGNTVIWKPSEKTPLTAMAMRMIFAKAASQVEEDSTGLLEVVFGAREVGEQLVASPKVQLVSATGSTEMGRTVGVECARRFKRSILELGGNNAAIVTPSARLDLVVRAVTFSAVGTAGQRCTTLRRILVHESIYEVFLERLTGMFGNLSIGNPLDPETLVGPLIDRRAAQSMHEALEAARAEGGRVQHGEVIEFPGLAGTYVRPALVEMPVQCGPMLRETFAPILYITRYTELVDAIEMNNAASHGLSSSIFTSNLHEAELFTSAVGSDCGIANVNIGTSGAEIGGAFGGEKETGGGRESGSDAWKGYMRRTTNTINYSNELPPLSQGVIFNV